MITDKLFEYESPLNNICNNGDNSDIKKLLLSPIHYTKTTIGVDNNSIISRNVEGFIPEEKINLFTYISEDCTTDEIYKEPISDKYNRLIKKNQTCDTSRDQNVCENSESSDENIDNLISNINTEITNINSTITKIRTIWKSNYAYLNTGIPEYDKNFIERITTLLGEFTQQEDECKNFVNNY
jgi:hypothetical protein